MIGDELIEYDARLHLLVVALEEFEGLIGDHPEVRQQVLRHVLVVERYGAHIGLLPVLLEDLIWSDSLHGLYYALWTTSAGDVQVEGGVGVVVVDVVGDVA